MLTDCKNSFKDGILTVVTEFSPENPIMTCVERDRRPMLPWESPYQTTPVVQPTRYKRPLALTKMESQVGCETSYSEHRTPLPIFNHSSMSSGERLTYKGLRDCNESNGWLGSQTLSSKDSSPHCSKEYMVDGTCSMDDGLACIACVANHNNGQVHYEGRTRSIQGDRNIFSTRVSKKLSHASSSATNNIVCDITPSANTPEDALIISDPTSVICENSPGEASKIYGEPAARIRRGRRCNKKHRYYHRRYPMKVSLSLMFG